MVKIDKLDKSASDLLGRLLWRGHGTGSDIVDTGTGAMDIGTAQNAA
jgi:hypothetical protein